MSEPRVVVTKDPKSGQIVLVEPPLKVHEFLAVERFLAQNFTFSPEERERGEPVAITCPFGVGGITKLLPN